ncbi:MAG: hypothetical protein JXB88_15575 [Spirochaetales bacterium]|nr:hypothetical protein [Spirochaetales bacterium]
MFDNIIGQKNTIRTLKTEIRDSTLPRAMLFCGPPFAGKLSTALETARILTCDRKSADWTCDCQSCLRNRILLHPNLLLLGYRDFSVEVAASAQVYQKTESISGKYLFIRSVRKLLKRFDPVLYNDDNTNLKKVRSSFQEIEEFLDAITVKTDVSPGISGKSLNKIITLCQKISGTAKTKNIPIDHIRKAVYWAHISTSGTNKIIIIENADRMLDSSRNSLLKILEEPPGNIYIILLTSRKGAIIKTILSRLRPYHFTARTKEETHEILRKIFKEEPGELLSLRDYFLSWEKCNPTALRHLARKYIEHILADDSDELDIKEEMAELFESGAVKTALVSFAEELTCIFQQVLHKASFEQVGFNHVEKWAHMLTTAIQEYELYNLNPTNVIESLYYKMKALL